MKIIANALEGNAPRIPFIKIINPDGKTVFFGREDGIWTNQELLHRECVISSGYDHFVCTLTEKWVW